MFDKVTITYRGPTYEIGRGRDFYGIWPVGGPRSHPLQWWPETAEGWSAAWSRFTEVEVPGTIVPVGRRTPPIAQNGAAAGVAAAPLAAERAASAGPASSPPASSPAAPGITVLDERPAPYADGATSAEEIPYAQGAPFAYETPFAQGGPRSPGAPSGQKPEFGPGATPLGTRTGAVVATVLLAAGVILGIAGLFPDYLAGASLTQQTPEVVPHAIYLAVWTVSAVLIMLGGGGGGGGRLRLGALLGAGASLVTFGLFFADAGTAIVAGAHEGGWGLWLSLAGWLACAAGSVLALLLRPAGGQRTRLSFGRARGAVLGPVVVLVLAGLGVAAAFAPAWDSYTLRTAAGVTRSLTEGNAFSNPGLVIAGDVAVMIALAVVVILAAVWRPVRHGAVLLAGAAIAMVAQAISAGIQVGEGATPAQFGFTPGQASQLGLTIDSGVTLAFWLYCGFLLVLIALCGWMLFTPYDDAGSASARLAGPDAFSWPAGILASGAPDPGVPSSVPSPPEEGASPAADL